jgi:hypothetical protein
MPSMPDIADRGEFIDVLNLMRKGRLLVRSDLPHGRCLIEGGVVYHAYETLAAYGELDELAPPAGAEVHAPHLHWYLPPHAAWPCVRAASLERVAAAPAVAALPAARRGLRAARGPGAPITIVRWPTASPRSPPALATTAAPAAAMAAGCPRITCA